MKKNPRILCSRNVENNITCKKNTPPPQTPPHLRYKNQQGNRGYIGYRFPLSLSTIWRNHLPFNQWVKGQYFHVENSIKREMKWERIVFLKSTAPPPPWICFQHQFFLMLELAWNAKKTRNIENKILKFYFFQYLKNSYKIQTTFHQYPKKNLYSTPPMTWCTFLQKSFEKIHQNFSCYSAKTKRDGQTYGRTDRQTDGGRCNISRPRAYGAAGDN